MLEGEADKGGTDFVTRLVLVAFRAFEDSNSDELGEIFVVMKSESPEDELIGAGVALSNGVPAEDTILLEFAPVLEV